MSVADHCSLRERGSALVTATVILLIVLAYVLASLTTSTAKVRDAQASTLDLTARYVAQAGFELQLNQIWNARNLANFNAPFSALDGLDSDAAEGAGHYTQTQTVGALIASNGETVGQFDVAVDVTSRADLDTRQVVITSIGYVPTKAAFVASAAGASKLEVTGVVRIALTHGEVFDYAYFINHWGWFYGDNIVCNGNARANGQFDFGGYAPYINGSPRYQSAAGTDLLGYMDDNNDGVTDGSDGGVYAGWGILSPENVRGMGGQPENQHSWQNNLPMPNLSNLGVYEALATSSAGTISQGGVTHVSGVLGDGGGEHQHLCLIGTVAQPIVIDGPVVVRGDVILKGVITGQGTVYAGRNVYVPDDLTYANGPTTPRPTANDEATVEAWRAANSARDSLGLFAREHVVVGNYTNSTWRSYVNSWINSSLNESREDAGADGSHNTRAGFDGILGTADDDVLEGDGVFTVEYYSAADAALGLIPAGLSVGNVIPGSGEDIDGDGVYDPRVTLANFDISAALNPTNWAGLTTTYANFGAISSIWFDRIDASFYTNHALAALMLSYTDILLNGTIISRNEAIIYGANTIQMNHDERLTGRASAADFGLFLPYTWDSIAVLQWSIGQTASIDVYLP